jgi:hypothetical protein
MRKRTRKPFKINDITRKSKPYAYEPKQSTQPSMMMMMIIIIIRASLYIECLTKEIEVELSRRKNCPTGTYELSCVSRSRKRISCVPRLLLRVYHTETRPNLPNRSGSEPSEQRGPPPPPHTHYPTSKFSTFSTTRYTWRAGHFLMFHMLWQ